jgi:hypothetical protein
MFVRAPKRWKALQFDEKVNPEIMRRFADDGIKLAPPISKTCSLILDTVRMLSGLISPQCLKN